MAEEGEQSKDSTAGKRTDPKPVDPIGLDSLFDLGIPPPPVGFEPSTDPDVLETPSHTPWMGSDQGAPYDA